jgi:hypothetical protein
MRDAMEQLAGTVLTAKQQAQTATRLAGMMLQTQIAGMLCACRGLCVCTRACIFNQRLRLIFGDVTQI